MVGAAAAGLLATAPFKAEAKEIVLETPGIPGPYCAYGAEKRLRELSGVESVTLSWEHEQIRILVRDSTRISIDDVKEAMKRADYPYRYEIRMGGE